MTVLDQGLTQRGDLTVVSVHAGETMVHSILPERRFLCGIVLGDGNWNGSWLAWTLRELMQAGASYLAFYGHRCEEAHDIADSERLPFTPDGGDDVIMTTWRAEDSIVEYFWFLAHLACPTPGYFEETNRHLILVAESAKPDLMDAVSEIFVSLK